MLAENDQSEVLEFTISAIQQDGEESTFSIDSLETVRDRKKLGDRIKLIQIKNKYYEYM